MNRKLVDMDIDIKDNINKNSRFLQTELIQTTEKMLHIQKKEVESMGKILRESIARYQ